MSFIETPRFPDIIALGSVGGPRYLTDVIELNDGSEQRNQLWAYPLHRYDVGAGANTSVKIDLVRAHYHAMAGRKHGFRFKDFNDYTSALNVSTTITNIDQVIGTGNGSDDTFPLVKIYDGSDSPAYPLTRKITKPVSGTVVVAVATVAQTEGVDFTVDTTTGDVVFTTPPASGSITAGYEFDVPVRFEDDLSQFEQIMPGIERATIGIIELRI